MCYKEGRDDALCTCTGSRFVCLGQENRHLPLSVASVGVSCLSYNGDLLSLYTFHVVGHLGTHVSSKESFYCKAKQPSLRLTTYV